MKYLYLFLFALTISACHRTKYIEIDGTITGLNNGAVEIKDPQGNQLISVLISEGKFHAKNLLPKAGFYDLFVAPDLNTDYKKKLYEVYLDGGSITITSNKDKLYLYPQIKSDAKIQNELSDYYAGSFQQVHDITHRSDSLSDLLYGKNTPLIMGGPDYDRVKKEFTQATEDASAIQAKTLGEYVSKNPQNDIEAFVMAQADYKKDPEAYNSIYQKFTTEQKNTVDGKQEGDDLSQLMKLAAGAPAPKISGKTLNGETFDPKSISGKKVILVEFWQSGSDLCEANHARIIDGVENLLSNKNFAIVSVSMDTKRDDWVNAIQKQKLSWVQVSDLKGQASLNMTDWAISAIPTYDLVDGNWHMIKRDVDFNTLFDEITEDLKK